MQFKMEIKTKPKKKKNIQEFSKKIIKWVMFTYFITALCGIVVVLLKDTSQFPALAGFVGTPVSIALGFYYSKASKENVAKINKSIEL